MILNKGDDKAFHEHFSVNTTLYGKVGTRPKKLELREQPLYFDRSKC